MITATQITQSVFGDDEIVDAAGKVSKPLSKLIDARLISNLSETT